MRTVLSGGLLIDGLGGQGKGSVILRDDVIEAVLWGSACPRLEDAKVIDVTGRVVAPGLIDMHSHDDVAATDPDVYQAKIRQGVTTSLIGLDGLGYAPLDAQEYPRLKAYWTPVNGDPGPWASHDLGAYRTLLQGQIGLNLVLGVPHGNLRLRYQGWSLNPLGREDLDAMTAEVEQGLDQGAYGLTTGLGYVPGLAADQTELLCLVEPLSARRKLYVSHLRNYGRDILAAVDEAVELGRIKGVAVHLSHLHLSHPAMFGRAPELLERIHQARAEGVAVTLDLYPYSAGSSILHSYLPTWLLDGGPDLALSRLNDAQTVSRLRADPEVSSYDWDRVVITRTKSGNHVGQSVALAAAERGLDAAECLATILSQEALEVGAVVHQTLPADDMLLAEDPGAVVGSDGIGYGQLLHPRYYGAFAAFFERHVVERKTLSMAEALSKMSTQTADIVGLRDRGRLQAGKAADVIVIDEEHFRPQSTYEHPRRFAEGVEYVFVNGTMSLAQGEFSPGLRPGRILTPAP